MIHPAALRLQVIITTSPNVTRAVGAHEEAAAHYAKNVSPGVSISILRRVPGPMRSVRRAGPKTCPRVRENIGRLPTTRHCAGCVRVIAAAWRPDDAAWPVQGLLDVLAPADEMRRAAALRALRTSAHSGLQGSGSGTAGRPRTSPTTGAGVHALRRQ